MSLDELKVQNAKNYFDHPDTGLDWDEMINTNCDLVEIVNQRIALDVSFKLLRGSLVCGSLAESLTDIMKSLEAKLLSKHNYTFIDYNKGDKY